MRLHVVGHAVHQQSSEASANGKKSRAAGGGGGRLLLSLKLQLLQHAKAFNSLRRRLGVDGGRGRLFGQRRSIFFGIVLIIMEGRVGE